MYGQIGDSKENSLTLKMSCHSKVKNNPHLLKSSLRARRSQQEAINTIDLLTYCCQLEQAVGNRGPAGFCESDLPTCKTSAHTLRLDNRGKQSHQGSQQQKLCDAREHSSQRETAEAFTQETISFLVAPLVTLQTCFYCPRLHSILDFLHLFAYGFLCSSPNCFGCMKPSIS